MIQVKIVRKSDNRRIDRFSVNGHAQFAKSGKDIVCAGVSAVTIGTVNAIEALLDLHLETSMNKGLLEVAIPLIEDDKQERVQLLLEAMIVMLMPISTSFNKYLTINEILE